MFLVILALSHQLSICTYIIIEMYRHEILTSELEKEKLFRFSHIGIGNVGKTE